MAKVKITEDDFSFDNRYYYPSRALIADIGDEVVGFYGMYYGVITDDDIKALQNGKIVVFDIDMEYRLAIKLGDTDDSKDNSN